MAEKLQETKFAKTLLYHLEQLKFLYIYFWYFLMVYGSADSLDVEIPNNKLKGLTEYLLETSWFSYINLKNHQKYIYLKLSNIDPHIQLYSGNIKYQAYIIPPISLVKTILILLKFIF